MAGSPWFNAAAMYGQWNAWIVVCVLVVMFAVALVMGLKARSVRKRSTQVMGTLSSEPKCVSKECRAKVAYRAAGEDYEVQLPVEPFSRAGDSVKLLVDPLNPSGAVIDAPNTFLSPWFVGCGALVIVLSVIVARAVAKNKKLAVASGIFSVAGGGGGWFDN